MSVRSLVLVFLLLPVTYSEKCIGSFNELEESLLSSDENMLNLVRAFYPANQHPALIVEVTYVAEDNDNITTNNTSIYVYRWVSSQVLIYSYPQFLQGLSLRTYSVVIYYANITVNPFCQNISSIEKIRLLNDATIWLKLYTTHRLSVIDHGADSSLQGYSSYKENLETNDFAIFEKEDVHKVHVYVLTVALISLLVASVIFTSSKLDSSYELLHMRCKIRKDKNQIFRFKSLFWAVISTLVLVIMFVAILDFYEIFKFGTTWNSTSISIYYLTIVVLVLSLFVCGVISMIIVVRAKKRGKLIALPMMLLCKRHQPFNYSQRMAISFYQFIGSFTILLASVAISIHGTGIVLAALANPLQVISTVATFVVALFYLTYAFADIYDHYENMFNVSLLLNCRSQVIIFILRLLTHVLVLLFFCLCSYAYLTTVIFIGGNSGVNSFIANVLPIILLIFITGLSKRELQKFVKFESSSNAEEMLGFKDIIEENYELQTFVNIEPPSNTEEMLGFKETYEENYELQKFVDVEPPSNTEEMLDFKETIEKNSSFETIKKSEEKEHLRFEDSSVVVSIV